MFQLLKMGGAQTFHQLDLDGVETGCPKVFQHLFSARTTGLHICHIATRTSTQHTWLRTRKARVGPNVNSQLQLIVNCNTSTKDTARVVTQQPRRFGAEAVAPYIALLSRYVAVTVAVRVSNYNSCYWYMREGGRRGEEFIQLLLNARDAEESEGVRERGRERASERHSEGGVARE